MRKDIVEYLEQKKELKQFIREQPHWYRTLSRNPNEIQSLEVAALHYYKKRFPTKLKNLLMECKWLP